jgi:hypothetical protein
MKSDQNTSFNSGSRWHRWDPHIHAPGTVLNDQFKGNWEGYIAALEASSPTVGAIGVTDYYSVETYERVLQEKKKGRLSEGPSVTFLREERRPFGRGRDV